MMKAGFTRKKVESMTLGEKLKKIRSEYRISLSEVAKHTKIQMKYLEYLENGEYEKLPAEVYVRGFVRSYANFLGTDEVVLVKMYERERNIQRNLKKEQFEEQRENTFSIPRFFVTPKLFLVSAAIFAVLGGFVYLYREFRSFAAVPRLVILEPLDGQVITDRDVYVRGTTEKDASLVINGQPVLVRDGGDFYEQVHLQPGLNAFTVISTNKFKKEKVVTLSVQADYETSPLVSQEVPAPVAVMPASLKTVFEIFTQDKPLAVSVEVDGNKVYNGVLAPGTNQVFQVEKEVKISSEDGSKTFVRMGEGALAKPISPESKKVKDIVFVPGQ
ncbi:MAG: helix-turn-helix domain-containing protein [Candidatus Moranbacteria bacterium]|nr:helix-turn-helix domain-containing protein [Candidatus Moranbacteria bacterium]